MLVIFLDALDAICPDDDPPSVAPDSIVRSVLAVDSETSLLDLL